MRLLEVPMKWDLCHNSHWCKFFSWDESKINLMSIFSMFMTVSFFFGYLRSNLAIDNLQETPVENQSNIETKTKALIYWSDTRLLFFLSCPKKTFAKKVLQEIWSSGLPPFPTFFLSFFDRTQKMIKIFLYLNNFLLRRWCCSSLIILNTVSLYLHIVARASAFVNDQAGKSSKQTVTSISTLSLGHSPGPWINEG